jgi:hypothetical protein
MLQGSVSEDEAERVAIQWHVFNGRLHIGHGLVAKIASNFLHYVNANDTLSAMIDEVFAVFASITADHENRFPDETRQACSACLMVKLIIGRLLGDSGGGCLFMPLGPRRIR